MNSMSPPVRVHAKPVTTPGTLLFLYLFLSKAGPRTVGKSEREIVALKSSPKAICFALLRINLAINFSNPRTPLSFVYEEIIFSITAFENLILLETIPRSPSNFGIRCFFAISSFSSMVYPLISIISIRSLNAGCIVERSFAVAINRTLDKSYSISTKLS